VSSGLRRFTARRGRERPLQLPSDGRRARALSTFANHTRAIDVVTARPVKRSRRRCRRACFALPVSDRSSPRVRRRGRPLSSLAGQGADDRIGDGPVASPSPAPTIGSPRRRSSASPRTARPCDRPVPRLDVHRPPWDRARPSIGRRPLWHLVAEGDWLRRRRPADSRRRSRASAVGDEAPRRLHQRRPGVPAGPPAPTVRRRYSR
jgi:hypothetical protein